MMSALPPRDMKDCHDERERARRRAAMLRVTRVDTPRQSCVERYALLRRYVGAATRSMSDMPFYAMRAQCAAQQQRRRHMQLVYAAAALRYAMPILIIVYVRGMILKVCKKKTKRTNKSL